MDPRAWAQSSMCPSLRPSLQCTAWLWDLVHEEYISTFSAFLSF